MSWFRVPQWCMAIHDEPSAQRARAWVYLLGAWHSGDDPSTRELRRVTGFGGPRADALVGAVAAWARDNGAAVPERVVSAMAREAAGQERGTSGALPGHSEPEETPKIKPERGTSGAEAGQERGARARVPFSEREKRGEEITERAPEAPPLPTDEDLYTPLTLFLLPAPEAPQDAPTPATHATAPSEPVGEKGGARARGKRATATLADTVHAPVAPPAEPMDLTAALYPYTDLARRLAAYVVTVEELRAKSVEDLQYMPGVGPDRAARIARLMDEKGMPLAVKRASQRVASIPPAEVFDDIDAEAELRAYLEREARRVEA